MKQESEVKAFSDTPLWTRVSRLALVTALAGLTVFAVGLTVVLTADSGHGIVFMSLLATPVAIVGGFVGTITPGSRIEAIIALVVGIALAVAWTLIIRDYNRADLSSEPHNLVRATAPLRS